MTSVIVTGIQTERIGQRENLIENGFVQCVGIALLEIGATAASNQKSISRESHSLFVADISHTSY